MAAPKRNKAARERDLSLFAGLYCKGVLQVEMLATIERERP